MDKDTKAAVKAALEFYADKSNYAPDISEVTGVNHETGKMEWDIPNIEADEGERARDALELIEREGDEIKDAAGIDKAVVALDIIEKLYYNGQAEEGESQAALVRCMLVLNQVAKDHQVGYRIG